MSSPDFRINTGGIPAEAPPDSPSRGSVPRMIDASLHMVRCLEAGYSAGDGDSSCFEILLVLRGVDQRRLERATRRSVVVCQEL